MSAPDLLRDPIWQRLALALLHFVWQGALTALVVGGLICVLRVRRPQVRYAVWLGGLALMALCPAVTFVVAEPSIPIAASLDVAAGETAAQPWSDAAGGLPASQSPSIPTNGFREQVAWAVERQDRLVALVAPYLVLFWFAGVGIFGGRLLLGFAGVHWLALGRRPPGAALAEQAALLTQRIGLRRVPRVAICTRAGEALALGFLRPLILLPAAWLTELPPEVLRAVLAHELAHIRRRDVWVNLLQRVIETLLFYHPAVWWISRRVRAERELCCDDLAVTATGGRVEYAQALECVARRRLAESSPLLAAGIGGRKMALLKRVRHVLGTEPDEGPRAGRWSAGLIALAVPPALWLAVSVLAPPVVGQEEREREVRERERSDSAEARERERERDERTERQRDRGDRVRERDPGFPSPEFEEALRDAQRQAREAQARAEEARRHAEEMVRRMMQRRDERLRSADERSDDVRERETDRLEADFSEMMQQRRRLPARFEAFGPGGPPFPGLLDEVRRLREEIEQLRREVQQMQGDGDRRTIREGRGDRRTTERPAEADYELDLRERDGQRMLLPRAVIRRPGPDRPPHPPGPPDAPRVRIEREERLDENRREEAREPQRDEPREGEQRDEGREPEGEAALMRSTEQERELGAGEHRRKEQRDAEKREDILAGEVLSKHEGPTGSSRLIEVSLGWKDGLSVRKHLDVLREAEGGRKLGRIEIVWVGPDRAIGRITQRVNDVTIEKGDSVTAKLSE